MSDRQHVVSLPSTLTSYLLRVVHASSLPRSVGRAKPGKSRVHLLVVFSLSRGLDEMKTEFSARLSPKI